MERLDNSFLQRKLTAAKALVRWTFNNLPTSDFGRSNHLNVVDVATRTHELVEGSFPPEDAEWTRYEDGQIVHTPPVQPSFWDERGYPHYPDETSLNREDHPALWDDMGCYFDGSSER